MLALQRCKSECLSGGKIFVLNTSTISVEIAPRLTKHGENVKSNAVRALGSAEALPEIHDLWHNFLRASALDYQRISQKELTKCKTEDQKAAAKFIGVAELMKYSVRSMA
ncbi:hypothetical protein EJB05_11575, partial [Eragrostis curvula]